MRIEERKPVEEITEEKVEEKETKTITLSEIAKINGKIYEKDTQFIVKEESEKDSDIVLESAIRVGDDIISKDSVLEVIEDGLKEELNEDVRSLSKEITSFINTELKRDRSESMVRTVISTLAGAIRIGTKNSMLPVEYYDLLSNLLRSIE